MFAASAHTFLRGDCPRRIAFFLSCKDILELNHARIGKEQGRIILGHERAGGNDLVTGLIKVIQKVAADIAQAGHFIIPERLLSGPIYERVPGIAKHPLL